MTQNRYSPIWGAAHTLGMSSGDVHDLVAGITGKASLTELTSGELLQVRRELDARQKSAGVRRPRKPRAHTGNPGADELRGKILALSYELGWEGDAKRLDGMAQRMFGVSSWRWLTAAQCIKLVEAMRAMLKRRGGGQADDGTGYGGSGAGTAERA